MHRVSSTKYGIGYIGGDIRKHCTRPGPIDPRKCYKIRRVTWYSSTKDVILFLASAFAIVLVLFSRIKLSFELTSWALDKPLRRNKVPMTRTRQSSSEKTRCRA